MRATTILAIAALGASVLPEPAVAGTIKGEVSAKRAKFVQNVVLYIDEVEGEFAPAEEPALMDQQNLTFVPHVLPVLVGTTVAFLNSDDVLHNVFTPDKCAEKFNLGSWPKGEKKSHTFDELGCAAVMLCNVHPEMEAFVLVLQNPYYSVTNEDGTFAIENVPAGTYELRVWSEKLKAAPQEVVVPNEGSVDVAFTLER